MFTLLAVAVWLPCEARAQWTQPDAANNINNTNAGNVGVGTSAPSAKLHVTSTAAGTPAMKIRGAAGQTGNLLEFRTPDDALRSFINQAGALFFNPAMDQVPAAITIAPSFNGAYYATAEHNTFKIDGAAMSHYGLYTNPTVRMFLIKDVNGLNAVEVNKIGMTTLRGDMSNRPWVTNFHVDSSNAYYAGDADGLLINGSGLTNHGLYTGGNVRLLRVVGTGEALAVTRHNLTGFGTLTPGARVDIVGTGSTTASAALSVRNSASSSLFYVRDDGNVGVGTGAPTHKLDVAGNVNASLGLCIAGVCKNDWSQVGGSSQWAAGASGAISYNSGNVGVGTSSPAAKLHVAGGARLEGAGRLYLGTGAVQGARGLEVVEENPTTFSIRHHDPLVAWRNVAINPHGGDVGVGTAAPRGRFEVAGGALFLGDMGNASWGNVVVRGRVFSANSNIHLSPPGGSGVYIDSGYREAGGPGGPVSLHVSGDINAGGNISAKYQDVAEWVPSTQRLAAGTVVVLDAARSNHVVASGKAYDTAVAGVVSEMPGVILGVGGEGKVMVATTGRVRVKADATRGAIKVGDLLVTGEAEGVAMKSVPVELGGVTIHRPGTIVGKALEPLEKGVGEILVLLSLQ